METVRAHFRLPADLLNQVEMIAGKRRRNHFVEEAIREHVRRIARTEALRRTAGILAGEDHPDWKTPEAVSAWVRELREEDNRRTGEKLRGAHCVRG